MEKINFNLYDFETEEEIEGVQFQGLLTAPLAGDHLHYWEDTVGTGDWNNKGIRRDFVVKKIEHDLRYMVRSRHSVHMIVLYVTESIIDT